jgi:hypothetical protein
VYTLPENETKARLSRTIRFGFAAFVSGFLVASLLGAAFWLGTRTVNQSSTSRPLASLSEAVLHATATHGGTNVAVATGPVSEDVDGIYILDYLTGNLQCWVYNPRLGQFGGKFETNVFQQLPASKNAEFLLVTGASNAVQASGNSRPAASNVYVVDTRSGAFAGYSFMWSRPMEVGGQFQKGNFGWIGGDYFRLPSGGASAKKAQVSPTKEAPTKEKAPATK